MFRHARRDLIAADLRAIEPDVLGALALVLYGRDRLADPRGGAPLAQDGGDEGGSSSKRRLSRDAGRP